MDQDKPNKKYGLNTTNSEEALKIIKQQITAIAEKIEHYEEQIIQANWLLQFGQETILPKCK